MAPSSQCLCRIRILLWVIMSIVFSVQVSVSIDKFVQHRIGKTMSVVPLQTVYPSVTIGIYLNTPPRESLTFEQVLKMVPKRKELIPMAKFARKGNESFKDVLNISMDESYELWSMFIEVQRDNRTLVCYTFNLPFDPSTGSDFMVNMNLSRTMREGVFRVHMPGHMYHLLKSGRDQDSMALSYRTDDVYFVTYLTIGKLKLLNNENNMCSDQHDRFGDCLTQFVIKTIGCFWLQHHERFGITSKKCNTRDELQHYIQVCERLLSMMPKQASKHTGCIMRCTLNTYKIDVYRTRVAYEPGLTSISLSHTQEDMISEEEHYVYDVNNLIAEIGGYLGLLLGASVMSFYDAIVHLAVKTKSKSKGRKRIIRK